VSRGQSDALDALLRHGRLDLGGDVLQQRAIFDEKMAAIPIGMSRRARRPATS
jgi:epsilon-lactone hydrolase